jgi:hypothetical protein
MGHKPDLYQNSDREALAEDAYTCRIVRYELTEKPEAFYSDAEKERGNTVFQYKWTLEVAVGAEKGRYIPPKYTTARLSTFEKNGLYNLLRMVPGIEGKWDSLKERIEAGDAPDFDDEVVGRYITVDLEVREDGRNKIAGIRKSKKQPSAAEKLEAEGATEVTGDNEEVPF